MNKDFWMEDVNSIALKATTLVEEELKKFGIVLEVGEEDNIFTPICNYLESLSNGNYRHEH